MASEPVTKSPPFAESNDPRRTAGSLLPHLPRGYGRSSRLATLAPRSTGSVRELRDRVAVRLLVALTVAAAAGPALAAGRGWQGVTPGVSTESEVTSRFGPPSTEGKLSGRTALVYKGDQAIPGTRQAQFFARGDGVVVEVVVFPANALDKEAVEGTYGHPTQKAFTDDFRTVWIYKASGVTVYFGKDATVDAISFKATEGAAGKEPRAAAPGTKRSAAPAAAPGAGGGGP